MNAPMRRAALVLACLLGALGAVSGGGVLHAQGKKDRQLQIEAPHFNFDRATHTYTYEDGKLTLGDLVLFASHLELNTVTGEVRAHGFIRVQNKELYGTANALEMNAKTRKGTFHNAKLYLVKGGLFVRADTVVIHEDGRLELEHCDLTSCKPDVPAAWHLSASSMRLKPDSIGVAWNPVVSLGPVPAFWFPIIAWPTVNERSTGFLGPRISEDTSSLERYNLGLRVQTPVFVNLGFDQDLTLRPEIISHRGLALGMDYNYAFWPRQIGQLNVWRLQENKPRDPTQENDILTPAGLTPPTSRQTRYTLDWSHNQALGDDGRLVLTYNDSSDGQVRQEYFHVTEYRPYHTYQASLTSQGHWINSALTYEQTANFTQESVYAQGADYTNLRQIPQLLPSLNTHLGGEPLHNVPLRLDLGLRAARFVAPQSISGNLLEAVPSVSLPISLGGAFELRPTFSRRMVAYTGLVQGNINGSSSLVASQAFDQNTESLELRTSLARVYPADGRPYEAIKHRLVPRLIYKEVQDVPQPFTGELEPTHLAEKLFTIRFDNTLLGRAPAPPPKDGEVPETSLGSPQTEAPVTDLLHLNVIQNYNLLLRSDQPALVGPKPSLQLESAPNHPWMPLQIELTVNGSQIQASANLHYHYQLHRFNQYDLALGGRTESGANLGIDYQTNEFNYVTLDNQVVAAGSTFGFSGSVPFSDTVSMGFNGRINLVDGSPPLDRRLDSDGLVLTYHPACYSVEAVYSEAMSYTLDNNKPNFYVDRHLRIIFDLSSLIGGIRHGSTLAPSVLSSNGPRDDNAPASCHG